MSKASEEFTSNEVKSIRQRLGLGRTEFSNLLGLGRQGERTVRGWEQGEHKPSKKKLEDIQNLESKLQADLNSAPFRCNSNTSKFKFIDLFAGIGGIRLPFQKLGGECVFTSEWDKFAQKTYLKNFGEMPRGDITKIKTSEIPDHDVLLAGFPCQAFSQAGLKKGFNDTRGTLFFEIQRILANKRPKAFLLENVKQLKGHDKGRTLKTILNVLRGESVEHLGEELDISTEAKATLGNKLNYWVDFKVLRAADFGVPQNRERIFIVGFDREYFGDIDFEGIFEWPTPPMLDTKVDDILEDDLILSQRQDKYTISDKLWEGHQNRKLQHAAKGNGFGYSLFNRDSRYTNTISARYYKDGSEVLIDQSHLNKNPRKLTPRECARLQGFPENFIIDAVSQVQIYKQFGNSVCMTVIEHIADSMLTFMENFQKQKQAA
ncbi:DNA (cytosine-5-)-methyltransferase [Agaribacter flavus]|uniref:Cytosine-specific methyltransferase n=1 Tax=Agaribacter flavus TaxID=1902781 RepID=A0ABV7FRF4_9ALTE